MSGLNNLDLKYTGSVKNVWQSASDPDHLLFEFTDDYSVFDWGKMPDQIAHKGRSLALIGTYFFRLFADPEFWKELPASDHLKKFDASFLAKTWESDSFKGRNGLQVNGLRSHFVAWHRPFIALSLVPR